MSGFGKVALGALAVGAIAWLASEPEPREPPKKAGGGGGGGRGKPPPPGGALADKLVGIASGNEAWEAALLQAVEAHAEDPIEWAEVTSEGTGPLAGYKLVFRVMADALSFDGGMRPIGSYRVGQRIADARGWLVPTPWGLGLASEQAKVKIAPVTMQPAGGTKANMLEANRRLDKAIAGRSGLVDNAGKAWVLTLRFTQPGKNPQSGVPYSQAAANFGLFTSPWHPTQTVGLFHDLGYADYSQMFRFFDREARLYLPGEPEPKAVDLAKLVQDPQLAPLLTGPKGAARGLVAGEGPLPYYRHPAVPPYKVG